MESEIPLFFDKNDPFNILLINKKGKNKSGLFCYEIKLTKPLIAQTFNEPQNSLLDSKMETYFTMSSSNSWKDFGNQVAQNYEKVIDKGKFSDEFLSAIDEAKKIENDIERINYVTSFIQDRIRYLGDWKNTEVGGLYPRSINKIIDTQYGDCKDFSALTVAMLRKLGFKSNFALVIRQEINGNLNYKLPGMFFNHAIVYAKSDTGVEYWIDPTNVVSMAQAIFPDIADRYALILDKKNSVYTKTSSVDFLTNKIELHRTYNLRDDELLQKDTVLLSNQSAISLTAAHLYNLQSVVSDYLYKRFNSNIEEGDKICAIIPDLTSRIVGDIQFSLEYKLKHPYIRTNSGKALSLDWEEISTFVDNNNIHDLYIGSPRTVVNKYIFDKEVKNIGNLNAELDSPWYRLRLIGYIDQGKTIVNFTKVVKKSYITKEETKRAEYQVFKNNVSKNFRAVQLVFPY